MNESLILSLIDKLDKSGIAGLEYSDGTSRLVLRKAGPDIPDLAADIPSGGGAVPGTSAESSADGAELSAAPAPGETITSPIVGTFYAAPNPDAPPFVRAGSKVKAGDTLCILEAMKMMNQLEAEFDCEISAVKAASGDMVEFGQALFEVRRLKLSAKPRKA
jgi:acetyl-CoA carboxylase biotin carboxyl carrier protein